MDRKILRVISCLLVLCVFAPLPQVKADDFYKGKTIRIVVGFLAGDVYDLWARLYAQHMPKHIPGKPDIIVQNMTGAGSMIAANHVYSVAKPDGLTLGSTLPALYFDQLIGRKEVQFDWAKFVWVGSPVQNEHQMYMRSDAPYKTIEDIRKATVPPKCGTTGTGSTGYYIPKLMEEALGSKFNLVTGYQGGQDIDLAVERGELHCRAFTIEAFFAREPFLTWRKKGFVRNVVQSGRTRDSKLPDTPTIYELMDKYKTPEAVKRLAAVLLSPGDFGRPVIGPPGIPADRIKILRDGFMNTLKDPELAAEAKKRGWDLSSITGDELDRLAKEIVAQPPEVIERMQKLFSK